MSCPTSELSGNLPGSLTVSLSLFTLCCHLNFPTIRAFLGSFLIDQSLGAIRFGFGQQSLHAMLHMRGSLCGIHGLEPVCRSRILCSTQKFASIVVAVESVLTS
jgi:hypothetical protein